MTVKELEVKINAIKNSDEYLRLLTRPRGPLEERQLHALNQRIRAFEVQISDMKVPTSVPATPFRPDIVSRGLPPPRNPSAAVVAAKGSAHTGRQPPAIISTGKFCLPRGRPVVTPANSPTEATTPAQAPLPTPMPAVASPKAAPFNGKFTIRKPAAVMKRTDTSVHLAMPTKPLRTLPVANDELGFEDDFDSNEL